MWKYDITKKVADLLRSLFINHYESEPYHQHQNKAEQCYAVVKRYINTLMNLTGARSLLAIMSFVCPQPFACTASPALGGLTSKKFHSSLTLMLLSKRQVDQHAWPMGKGLLLLDSVYVKYL